MEDKYLAMHLPRLRRTAQVISKEKHARVLDIGAHRGFFSEYLRMVQPNAVVVLADVQISRQAFRDDASVVRISDMNTGGLPFRDNSFDLVTCLEVIEHLAYPDNLLGEVWRVLRPGGKLVVTTPNLASWANRLLLLAGYMPVSQSLSLLSEEAGQRDIPWGRPKTGHQARFDYHVRCYTRSGLETILRLNGFGIDFSTCFYGYSSSRLLWHIVNWLVEKLAPPFGQTILMRGVAIKPDSARSD